MSYNFLKQAHTIRNSFLCRYDGLDSYTSDFHTNGNVDSWDIYNNIYLYGCWEGVLFGTAYDRSCYISRTINFLPVAAENYYYIKIMMKITTDGIHTPATGRIAWQTLSDPAWDTDKQADFTIIADDKWHLYDINLGPESKWHGNVCNLRVYPFVDGHSETKFAIKYIKIGSLNTYSCSNRSCDYYINYVHNCPGAGSRGNSEAGISSILYTTVSGISDELVVDIDQYGLESFRLGSHTNLGGVEMARVVAEKLSRFNLGGYTFVDCEYDENDKLKIISGTVGSDSSVTVSGTAAAALGFYSAGINVATETGGADSASGFDYASARLLTAYEINRLIDNVTDSPAYTHNPTQYNVEGGRRDFNDIGTAILLSSMEAGTYYESLNNYGRTIIDFSHPIDNNGRLKAVYLYGIIDSLAKVKIFRPRRDKTLEVIYSLNLPQESASYIYTANPTNYRLDCDILVNKGDLIGVYNANLYVGQSPTGLPDATFCQVDGDVSGIVSPGEPMSFGVGGLAIYARGDRYQTNTIIDIDFGDRVNISEMNIYGSEESGYFEFNIAACKDITWTVDLFSETHVHPGTNWWTGEPFYHTHTNIAYGTSCLNDCIRTPDNGQVGTSYGKNANGLWTAGLQSYFYVNGDAEWLYNNTGITGNNGKYEYYWPSVPNGTYGFGTDPVSFTMIFPHDFRAAIHKTAMYFKERNNFRNLALSYYLGSYDRTGNADTDSYRYVPNYNSIWLDGTEYVPTSTDVANDYIFNNPMDDAIVYAHGDYDPINWEVYRAGQYTTWTSIVHEFDPIECYGFRFYTNRHRSTKINEIEVYSRVAIDPSLVDNVSLSFSDYGDTWVSVGFIEITESHVSGFLGGAPRYLKLNLESSTEFTLNEIECSVTDQLHLSKCEDNIYLDEAKRNVTNAAKAVVITNEYDKPFDLSIDIPKAIPETDDLVFYSRLNSQEDLDDPQIGPSCSLFKSEDFEIGNDNFQCAINCPSYGLKNLVDGKECYTQGNTVDWISYGALSSGISLNYTNNTYRYTEFTFPDVSSDYWKISFPDIASYTMGFVRSADWHTEYYSTPKCTFTYDTANYFSDLTFTVVNMYPYDINAHDLVYKTTTPTITNTTVFEIRFKIKITDSGGPYLLLSAGLINQGAFYGTMCQGVNVSFDKYSGYIGFFIQGPAGNDGVWNGSWTRNVTYYVRLWSDGANHYYCKVWTDNWNGSNLVSNCSVTSTKVWSSSKLGVTSNFSGMSYAYFSGTFSDGVIFSIKDIIAYKDSARETISKVYYSSVGGVTHQSAELSCDGSNLSTPISIRLDNNAFGFKLNTSNPLNKIRIVHNNYASIGNINVYTSPDNLDDYFLWKTGATKTTSNSTFNAYVAIDLEKRHTLDIIRNFGPLYNKLYLSTTSNVVYSNTVTNDPDSVVWATGSKDDARWARISLLCGDTTVRNVDKLGIYPDVSSAYCLGGGYNCEWESLGTILTDYAPSINVAYGCTVTGTNYYFLDYYPDNVVDGISDDYRAQACWGFQTVSGVKSYLELDFGATYLIDKIKLYHGYDPKDSSYLNTAYTFSVSTSTSGSFTDVLVVTGNTEFERTHQFTPTYARRARLTMDAFTTERQVIYDDITETFYEFVGSYLRDIEVYNYMDEGYVDSETWPVVCVNLNGQFSVTDHSLVNKDPADTATNWDNNDAYFKYSDSLWDDPEKVGFYKSASYVTQYSSSASSGNVAGACEYVFSSAAYFEKGRYSVVYDGWDVTTLHEVSLRLDGAYTVDFYGDNIATATNWVTQSGTIDVPAAGFYAVKGVQHIDCTGSSTTGWGVRYPRIYRSSGLMRWVSVKRDTATNYSFNNVATSSGIDYLSQVKVYGDTDYRSTEYSSWWQSTNSTLSNNAVLTKVGSKSLEISYPTSSGTDIVDWREGDDFGQDIYFDVMDVLRFWWYISDITKLDTDFGAISFGIINNAEVAYYTWDIDELSLVTGWNEMKLQFKEADHFYPTISDEYATAVYIDTKLDFRNNGRDFSSFKLQYRGKGQPFTMNIDDLKIMRNTFEDAVQFGKGLCLTGYDYLDIPLSEVSLEHGTIEFWMKTYTDSYGINSFNDMSSRVLFTVVNNNNDIVSLGIKSGNWLEPVAGHIRKSLALFDIDNDDLPSSSFFDIDQVTHIAFVWSNDGSRIDNGDTIRLYMNGELLCASRSTWIVGDTKSATLKLGGGTTYLAHNHDAYGSAIFENLRIYNFCKCSFDLVNNNAEKSITYDPNDFMEISQDGMTFYGADSANLPIVFTAVPSGDSRTIYIRANKNDNFLQSKYTGTIVFEWLTSV